MNTTSIESLTSANAPQNTAAATSAPALGRDDFLALLVAKLENQDPLDPAGDTEFVSQLATFSSLEQLIDVNDNLQGIGQGQALLVNSQALGLIGKEALVEAGGEVRIKNGEPETLVYAVPREANAVTMTIRDANGVTVRTLDLQTSPNGRVTVDWDGKDQDGNPLPDGDYKVEITATDTNDEPMIVPLFRSLPIDGVSFLAGGIALISGDREIPFETIFEFRAGRE